MPSSPIPADEQDYSLSVLPSSDPYHSIAADVSHGLGKNPPELPERYLYDELGSSLFESICQTEEYYPTRLEHGLIEANTSEIIDLARPGRIVELGSGSSVKTRLFFQNPKLREICNSYFAIDVSLSALEQSMASLSVDFPWLSCRAIAGDYSDALANLDSSADHHSLFLFLGGTIGNFSPENARAFLESLRSGLHARDHLLIGIDAVKSTEMLNRAYNDTSRFTERFNLNILRVINRELGADFDLEKFSHHAEFIEDLSAVQMSLISADEQVVSIPALEKSYQFTRGEKIITEHSYKYSPARAEDLLQSTGFTVKRFFGTGEYHLILATANG